MSNATNLRNPRRLTIFWRKYLTRLELRPRASANLSRSRRSGDPSSFKSRTGLGKVTVSGGQYGQRRSRTSLVRGSARGGSVRRGRFIASDVEPAGREGGQRIRSGKRHHQAAGRRQ